MGFRGLSVSGVKYGIADVRNDTARSSKIDKHMLQQRAWGAGAWRLRGLNK